MLDLLSASFIDAVATHLGCGREAVAALVGLPGRAEAGDLALPCFQLAKKVGKAPPALASELASALAGRVPGCRLTAEGPFLNLTLAPAEVAGHLLAVMEAQPQAALRHPSTGKTVCVDFSSPNIAKHLAFHHIRSTMIGNALARCYAAAGWQVVRINFLGDWGTAFGRLIAGWKREGLTLADLEKAEDQVGFLNALYVRISKAADSDPGVAEEARSWSRRLEDSDPEAVALWQIFKDASLTAFRRVYRLLDVDFDDWNGEAHYRNAMGPVIEELRAKDLLKADQGAMVVELSRLGLKKPCLILRSDGGSLYATRDLAACDDRHRKYRFDRCLYEVDLGQSLHFKEWFAVAKLLGRPYVDGLRHVGHGLVLMWNDETQTWEKTATRRGAPMMLKDVLDEAINRAAAIVTEKNPDLSPVERAEVAEAVGVAAVVFNDLKNGRKNDIKFRFEDALRFDGETGPYLQFAHARLCSIERKAAEQHPGLPKVDPGRITREDEKAVLLAIARLPVCLSRVVEQDEPSTLAQGLLHLAGTVSTWLTAGNADVSARVLCGDPGLTSSRLAVVRAARATLAEGLHLLGLKAPVRM